MRIHYKTLGRASTINDWANEDCERCKYYKIVLGLLVVCATVFSPISALSQQEQASFANGILTVPVLKIAGIDNVYYYIELELQNGSDPIVFNLTSAKEITDVSDIGASIFSVNILTIPSIQVDEVSYRVELLLISDDPVQLQFLSASVNSSEDRSEELKQEALTLFKETLSSNIIETRCIACHVAGGLARETGLVFQRTNISSAEYNFEVFYSFLTNRSDGLETILSKASGNNHTGGIQLPAGSPEYQNMQDFLNLLVESIGINSSSSELNGFFTGVTLESRAETLRKAAITLASRLPTQAEMELVANGDDDDLRVALRGLMEGEGFHQFILEATNDRLLTEGVQIVLGANHTNFPALRNKTFELEQVERETEVPFLLWRQFLTPFNESLKRAPGELVAYIARTERPYTEVVTANYMMMNPLVNEVLGGTAVFEDPTDTNEYQPGVIEGYYFAHESQVITTDRFGSSYVEDPGEWRVTYPHAGILNTPAFLARYPTTATNRNRARARWTFLHFLDIDIEKSSQRPTDADALTDTDNPTMNNPACTACHEIMDPVAAAFQNYDDHNYYRPNGFDALDRYYKRPEDGSSTPYVPGDTWYRDMRPPGLFSQAINEDEKTLQELARLIIQEPGFARASVKFWWPSVIGSDVLSPPAVAQDHDFTIRQAAYEAQAATIDALATDFSRDFNLKNLLVELMMTPWFNPSRVADDTSEAAHRLAGLGNEKLLTPERLQRKTRALTGYNWGARTPGRDPSDLENPIGSLENDYRLHFGGIDSEHITKRATEITPIMGNVALTHAARAACPIVLKEFALSDSQRKLFGGLTADIIPANGQTALKQKLVSLHFILLGKSYSADSAEIDAAYNLLVASWEEKKSFSTNWPNLFSDPQISCWPSDINYFNNLGFNGQAVVPREEYNDFSFNWASQEFNDFLFQLGDDPTFMKRSWSVVIAYLLSHYHYIYE